MKRFHVHIAVDDVAASIRFYSNLFGAEPTVLKHDYAKWMLDDPRLNFAISNRGHSVGINHLGLQVDSEPELEALREQLQRADKRVIEQKEQPCCYAKSDKYWVTDPVGIAWEGFHTLETIPVFGEDTKSPKIEACCVLLSSAGTRTKVSSSGCCS